MSGYVQKYPHRRPTVSSPTLKVEEPMPCQSKCRALNSKMSLIRIRISKICITKEVEKTKQKKSVFKKCQGQVTINIMFLIANLWMIQIQRQALFHVLWERKASYNAVPSATLCPQPRRHKDQPVCYSLYLFWHQRVCNFGNCSQLQGCGDQTITRFHTNRLNADILTDIYHLHFLV